MTYHPRHISWLEVEIPGAPASAFHLAPKSVRDVESVLRYSSEEDLVVQVWGGGTHSGYGAPPTPDIVMSTERLGEVEVWEPDDLTIVVGGGAPIEKVEAMLAERNQTLVMPERPGAATVGGVVASGVSSLRRGRLYATRERVLEVTMVTGDGRLVRSGGRVVKNVTGYDLHRMAVGAFGSLGVIVSVCLKLWPTPPGAATVVVDDIDQASVIVRPLSVLDVDGVVKVFLQGTEQEVETQIERLGGSATAGLDWPSDPSGDWGWSLRVPPSATGAAVSRLPGGWAHLAVHGVGEVRAASPTQEGADDLRSWAESIGGNLVMTKGDPSLFDPWGAPPPALALQRRLVSQFDPRRILNPGRLPGGV
ncbi:MAG TPA: FAD-binding protein [Acidimicrobiia bacterium]|nr:FAD-binding protein [Acidimicrobiia bacterium]